MKRLFTFGCSYTSYGWPTWADLLGLEFEQFENWGIPGIGCRAIQERVVECHARNNLQPGDVVIIQWSSHLRNDFHNINNSLPDRIKGWRTYGSIFSQPNHNLYSDQWLDVFFNERSFILHCLNSIMCTQHFLENLGVTWFMSSIGEWDKLGSDLDQVSTRSEIASDIECLWDTHPDLKIYKDKIWSKFNQHWITPHAIDAGKYPDYYWWFSTSSQNPKDLWREQHPSITQHSLWLRHIRSKLGLPNVLPEMHIQWVEEIEKIKRRSFDMLQFTSFLVKNNSTINNWPVNSWPKEYIGF